MSDVFVNACGQKVLAERFTALNAKIKSVVMAYFPAGSPKGTQPLYPNKEFLLSAPSRPGFAFPVGRDAENNQRFIELEVGDWLVVPLYSSSAAFEAKAPVDEPTSVPDGLFQQLYQPEKVLKESKSS